VARSGRRYTDAQWDELCSDMERLVGRLRRDGPELLRRAAIATRSGYPTTASGFRAIGGGALGDPTGSTAAANTDEPHRDPVRQAVDKMVSTAAEAAKLLIIADSSRAKARPPVEAEVERGLPGCVNCSRVGVYEPAEKAGRCGACYRYRLRNAGTDASATVIEARQNRRAPAGPRGAGG